MFNFLRSRKKHGLTPLPQTKVNNGPMVLLFFDGWGIAPPSAGNAIYQAHTPNMDFYEKNFPYGELIASGEAVGLPATEAGNSEVGHLTGGAGSVLFQSIMRINYSIKDLSFFENKAFLHTIGHVRKNNSRLHIMGLASKGEVHSALNHLYALIDFCKRQNLHNVIFHLFTDGRDSAPNTGIEVIKEIEAKLAELEVGRIGTVMGRYWAMDRDMRWERIQKAYEAIVEGKGVPATSASEALQQSYLAGKTDEFVEPVVIMENNQPVGLVNNNDGVIFFNFRIDRPRELSMAITMGDFENLKSFDFGKDPEKHGSKKEAGEQDVGRTFKRNKILKNLYFVSMTEYQKKIPVSEVAYPPEQAPKPMGAVVSEAGLAQLRLAESEKTRMVTYYFDGMRDNTYPGTDVIIVPSPKVPTYDKKPEMSVFEVVDEFKKALSRDKYSLFVMNFANPDMVAHTGNLEAAIKACEYVDQAVGQLVSSALSKGATVAITADHGNAEELITYPSGNFYFTSNKGEVNTEHSNKPVPLIIVSNPFRGKNIRMSQGALSDVAPTLLSLMGLPVPSTMTGKNLLEGLV